MNNFSVLGRVPLFYGLSKNNLSLVFRYATKRKYIKGDIIFAENASGSNLYIVLAGNVKIFVGTVKRKKTLTFLDRGDFFGELALLGKHTRSASAKAVTDCELLILSQNNFLKILRANSDITLKLIKELCERLRRADSEIESLTFNTVIGRTARVLLSLSKKYGKRTECGIKLKLPLDKKELAELIGTVREVATRVITHFKKLKYIDYKGRYMVIVNEEKLRSLIQ